MYRIKTTSKGKKRNRARCPWIVRIPEHKGSARMIHVGSYRTKELAEEAKRQAFEDRGDHRSVRPSNLTIRDLFERWHKANTAKLEGKSCDRYKQLLEAYALPIIGNFNADDLAPIHVSDILTAAATRPRIRCRKGEAGTPLGPRTQQYLFRALHRMLRWGKKRRLVRENVAADLERPEVPRRNARVFQAEEVARILDIARREPTLGAFVTLAATTAARRAELAAITWRDVDLERGVLHVRQSFSQSRARGTYLKEGTKNGSQRDVPLAPQAVAALRAQRDAQSVRRLDGGDFVFADANGNAIPLDELSKAFARIAKRAQVQGSLHTLRHSAVSLMLRGGTDAVTVAAIAGHKSSTTTLTMYAHVLSGAREEAILGLASSIAEARRKVAQ